LSFRCTDKNLGIALIADEYFKVLETREIDKLNVIIIDTPEEVIVHRLKNGIRRLLNKSPRSLGLNIWLLNHKMSKMKNIPKFKGLLKVHKKSLCVRPVIREANCPLHLFSSSLVKLLRNLLKNLCTSFQITHILDNSLALVQVLESFRYPTLCSYPPVLVTADVVSMYPSFKKSDVLTEIATLLNFWEFSVEGKTWLLTSIKFVLWNNYFSHNDTLYKSTSGVATGDPILVLLAIETYLHKGKKLHYYEQINLLYIFTSAMFMASLLSPHQSIWMP